MQCHVFSQAALDGARIQQYGSWIKLDRGGTTIIGCAKPFHDNQELIGLIVRGSCHRNWECDERPFILGFVDAAEEKVTALIVVEPETIRSSVDLTGVPQSPRKAGKLLSSTLTDGKSDTKNAYDASDGSVKHICGNKLEAIELDIAQAETVLGVVSRPRFSTPKRAVNLIFALNPIKCL
ncbi:hypothetical protein HG531_012421 [Fusarium graminearum]|nr:hypothetical protein HG531_012421 [Fusarium graminearum]